MYIGRKFRILLTSFWFCSLCQIGFTALRSPSFQTEVTVLRFVCNLPGSKRKQINGKQVSTHEYILDIWGQFFFYFCINGTYRTLCKRLFCKVHSSPGAESGVGERCVGDSGPFLRVTSQGVLLHSGEHRKIWVDRLPRPWPTCGGQCGPFYFYLLMRRDTIVL